MQQDAPIMDISSTHSSRQNGPIAEEANAMSQLVAATAAQRSRRSGFLSFMTKPASWVRSHRRYPCYIVGVLDILDRGVPLDGMVTEISEGGALFRTASTFIFDRRRAPVSLRFTDREWRGEIVNVKANGYGIRLDNPVASEEIEYIIGRYGTPDIAAN
jgi:PilZ domain